MLVQIDDLSDEASKVEGVFEPVQDVQICLFHTLGIGTILSFLETFLLFTKVSRSIIVKNLAKLSKVVWYIQQIKLLTNFHHAPPVPSSSHHFLPPDSPPPLLPVTDSCLHLLATLALGVMMLVFEELSGDVWKGGPVFEDGMKPWFFPLGAS